MSVDLGPATLLAKSLICTPAHVAACFSALEEALGLEAPSRPPQHRVVNYDHSAVAPFFVTLKKRQHDDLHLRGCIGSLAPRSLSELPKYALKSAFHDSRFEPLRPEELPDLECGVSLLVDYEEAEHVLDWIVGTHGIIINFEAHGQDYSATYLPEVAAEQGWTQEEAVESLIRKAGCKKLARAVWSTIRCTRYQSSKARMSYKEWLAVRTASADGAAATVALVGSGAAAVGTATRAAAAAADGGAAASAGVPAAAKR